MSHGSKITQRERHEAVARLRAERCSCVIRSRDGAVCSFHARGVQDLFRLLREEPEQLRGAFVADRVVGKAAAALMILGGVEELYAEVVSDPAWELLHRAGVALECGCRVPHIINRAKTGWCPLEVRCFEAETPEACLDRIEAFVAAMRAHKDSDPLAEPKNN